MKTGKLTRQDGKPIQRLGYGAMGLDGVYGETSEQEALATLETALTCDISMIDTADAYGAGHNEELISRFIAGKREKVFIATKFGVVTDPMQESRKFQSGWDFAIDVCGSSRYAAKALEQSLRRLELDTIDLWYCHYPDPGTPVEETVSAMAREVEAGKVRYLGLSNVTAEQVRRAHRVHPVAAVQYEYSLWRREAELDLLPTLRELGIALVAWSPLGAGFLTGDYALAENDMRHLNPRYSSNNLSINKDRFAPLLDIANRLEITPAQLAIAWLLHQGEDVYAIPGTRKSSRVIENTHALKITLDDEILGQISNIAKPGLAEGRPLL